MVLDPAAVSLEGKRALVTGAGRGIGEAVALALARFGADVAICDREADLLTDTADALRAEGRECVEGVFDVRDREAVEAFLGEVERAFGRVDLLVNNAAGTFEAAFLDLSPNAVDALVAENFTSAVHVLRSAAPRLADGASVVNVTSVEAHRAGPGFAVYSAMKAALANLTKSLALEWGGRGVRVNAVAPDVIPTPGIGDIDANTPLARRGHVDDVAGAVVFLASDLSGFVTGSTIHVDGGTWAAGGWHRQTDGTWRP